MSIQVINASVALPLIGDIVIILFQTLKNWFTYKDGDKKDEVIMVIIIWRTAVMTCMVM